MSRFGKIPGWSAALLCICAASLPGQTTQCLISGRVTDSITGQPLAGATIRYSFRLAPGAPQSLGNQASTDAKGFFVLPLLSPGTYTIKTAKAGYQGQEVNELELFVAAALNLDFALRPASDVWDKTSQTFSPGGNVILHYYASDVQRLESANVRLVPAQTSDQQSTMSYVVDSQAIRDLPLAGRDVYATLAVSPGVAADTGAARGLGLSVNGQRPASSNFMLDGVENNNTLVTGPLTALAPEMIQEYRVSIGTWSAEYGRTTGYIANAITRAGGESWHGTAYFNLKNNALDANDFQNNAAAQPRPPFHEDQYGFQTGGPVWRKKLFLSAGLELYRSRGRQGTYNVNLPTTLFVSQLSDTNPGKALFAEFPTPNTSTAQDYITSVTVHPTVSLNRALSLARADYVSGNHRFYLRDAIDRTDWPDFIWYPYTEFNSGLEQPVASIVAGYTDTVRPDLTHEAHASFSRATTRWDRAHPEIPTLTIIQTLQGPNTALADLGDSTLLPGSPAFYGLRNTSRTAEFSDNWLRTKGRHIVKAGGGLFVRNPDGLTSTAKDGQYYFQDFLHFLIDAPAAFSAGLSRTQLPGLTQPDYERRYRNTQYFLFAQDTWRVSRRLVLNGGIRYENYGAPSNTGATVDPMVQLAAGNSLPQSLPNASLVAGTRKLWANDNRDFAPRLGFAWDASNLHGPVFRGGYGIFYDRPFDNLWTGTQNNSVVIPPFFSCGGAYCGNYLVPVSTVLSQFAKTPFSTDFPSLTLIDPKLRSGMVQSFFLGARQRFSDALDLEWNAFGSRGRGLVTTDIVNRPGAVFNQALPEIEWRSNQGSSDYRALNAIVRYRPRYGYLQAAWTWSHSIDNQSDALLGQFSDLSLVDFSVRAPSPTVAAFSRPFDSSADRGNSNFDQRHNLVFLGWLEAPAASGRLAVFTRGWRLAETAAFRTGFPYTVLAPSTGAIVNQRANLIAPSLAGAVSGIAPQPGSVPLLNPAAFTEPASGVLGNTGRNAFEGPGLWNADLSISRTFALPRRENAHLILRSDFYNALNHANLNNPNSLLGLPGFGQASYGPPGNDKGFPALIPLNETSRQIQITIKAEF